jgi:hypothetical protein
MFWLWRRKARGLKIKQRRKEHMPSGIIVGAVGAFQETPEPTGSALPTGVVPAWTSSDVSVATVESPNSDATGRTIKVTGVAPGEFTLTVAATLPGGNVVQGTLQVAVTAPLPTSLAIAQLS